MAVYNSATGAETLAGTGSADTFVYNAVADSTTTASDTVTFVRAQGDKIDFSTLPLTGTGAPSALHWAGVDPTGATKAWGVWEWGDGSGALRIDTTGDRIADMSIVLAGAPVMQDSDFLFSVAPAGGGTQTGTSGNDTLTGTTGPDTLNGLAGADTINGGAGDDTINGGTGLDVMTGGAGADVFVFADNNASSSDPHDRITDFVVGTDKLQLPGAIVQEQQSGSDYYVAYGYDAADWLKLEGVGTLTPAQVAQLTTGGGSPPTPPPPTNGTSGNDTLTGTSGADTFSGLAGNDTISGLGGADNLSGGAGTDTISGGDGDDVINGGTGLDTVTGGAGADNFVFAAGDSSSSEPHDIITDFVVGTDRLTLPGAIIGTEDTGTDTYVHFADGNSSWLRLNGLTGLSGLDIVKLTDPGATEGEPPPNPGGGDLPAHTVVLHDTFDGGSGDYGHFTNRWGDYEKVTVNGDGAIRVTSPGDQSAQGGGAMFNGEGMGYGLYEFDIQASPNEVPGPYALLWPQDNVWPGAELDVVEREPGGNTYSAIHYDANPFGGGNEDNEWDSYAYEGISLTDRHSFAMNWQQGYIDEYVDGVLYNHITAHVPNDAANGGLNSLAGVGELTDWYPQGGIDNWINLYDFKYSVVA